MTDTQDSNISIGGELMTIEDLMRKMKLKIHLTKFSITCSETFQKRQFEPKGYTTRNEFDLATMWELFNQVDEVDQPKVRSALAQLIRDQCNASDDFQREIIRNLARLDGCTIATVDITDRRTANARVAGTLAAQRGLSIDVNPHKGKDERNSLAWIDGWQQVQGG